MYQDRYGRPTQDVQEAIDPPTWSNAQIKSRIEQFSINEKRYLFNIAFETYSSEFDMEEFGVWVAVFEEFQREYAGKLLDQEWFDARRR